MSVAQSSFSPGPSPGLHIHSVSASSGPSTLCPPCVRPCRPGPGWGELDLSQHAQRLRGVFTSAWGNVYCEKKNTLCMDLKIVCTIINLYCNSIFHRLSEDPSWGNKNVFPDIQIQWPNYFQERGFDCQRLRSLDVAETVGTLRARLPKVPSVSTTHMASAFPPVLHKGSSPHLCQHVFPVRD